ncbi:MAG: Tetratricopeptide repeat protein [bacterium ADurb.Bin429]|nr:MAG: Tetratricopeptide repeat protein [bacterium ADurb.Bin429]
MIRAKQMPEAREETDRLFTAAAKLTDSNGYYMLQDFHRQIAQAYHQAGAYTEAETAYREWLKFVEKTPEPSRGGVRIDPLGNAMNNWAGFYRNFGREAEAEKLLRRVAEQYQARGNVPDTTLVALAECLLSQNDIPEAEAQLKRSMSDPGSGYRPIIWAQALLPLYRGLAIMHAAAPLPGPGRSLSGVELDIMSRKPDAAAREAFAAAEPLLKAVKEHWDAEKRSTSEYNAQYTNYYNALAINSYASALIVQGKFAEAKPLLAKGRELAEAAQPVLLQSGRDIRVSGNIVFGELAPFFITQAALRFRELQAAQGSPKDVLADVVAPLEVALAERAELYGTWSPQYGRVLLNLGTAYAVTGETDKAKKALSEAKALFEGMLGKDDPAVATIAARLEKLK